MLRHATAEKLNLTENLGVVNLMNEKKWMKNG